MDDNEDDIFHMLLGEDGKGQKRRKEGADEADCDEDFSINFNVSVDRHISPDCIVRSESKWLTFEFIRSRGWSVLDHCEDSDFLYVLIECQDELAAVQIYRFNNENETVQQPLAMVTTLSTPHKSSLFKETKGSGVRHLYVVHQEFPTATSTSHPSFDSNNFMKLGNIYLPTSSFASIFGKATALTKSCVILLCAEDGCVFWGECNLLSQQRNYATANARFLNFLLFQLYSMVNSLLCVSTHCKKSGIDDDVSESLQKALSHDHNQPGTDGDMKGLLAVCGVGECVLLLPSMKQRPPGCQWIPVCFKLLHRVVCCVAKGNQLFYSTGSSVEVVTFTVKEDGEQPSVYLENCKTIATVNIRHLQFHCVCDESETQLMGLTNDMDLIPIPMTSSPSHTLAVMTQNVSNTLKNIEQHYASNQALQEKSSALDGVLSQLNVFASLSQQHRQIQMSSTSTDRNCSPSQSHILLHCECYCDHSLGYSRDSEIKIKVKNNTEITLSDHWSVLVRTEQSFPLSLQKCSADVVLFRIEKDLKPGGVKKLFVPVPECVTSDPSAKLGVRISMVLSTPYNFIKNQLDSIHTNQEAGTLLEVEIHTQSFDCLHFLTVSNNDDGHTSFNSHHGEVFRACLERLAQKRRKTRENENVDDSPGGKRMIDVKLHHAGLLVSEEKHTLEAKEQMVQTLFQDVKDFLAVEDKGSLLVCRTLFGTEISFDFTFVVEDKVDSSTDIKIPHLQMKLESADSVLLSAVHIALLERIQGQSCQKVIETIL